MRRVRSIILLACAFVPLPTVAAYGDVLTVDSGYYIVNSAETHTGIIDGLYHNALVYDNSGSLSFPLGVYLGYGPSSSAIIGTWDVNNAAGFTTSLGVFLGWYGQTGIFNMDSTGTITTYQLQLGTSSANVYNQDSGSTVVTNPVSSVTLAGGRINLNGGTFTASNIATAAGTTVFASGGTLSPYTTGSTLVSGAGSLTIGSQPLTIDTANKNTAINVAINSGASPDGGLIKNGAGDLEFKTGPNFHGPLTVNAGSITLDTFGDVFGYTLNFNGGNANFNFPSSTPFSGSNNFTTSTTLTNRNAQVNISGDVNLTGSATILTLASSGTINPILLTGGIYGAGVISVASNSIAGIGGTFNLNLSNNPVSVGTNGTFLLSGTPTLTGMLTLVDVGTGVNGMGTLRYAGGNATNTLSTAVTINTGAPFANTVIGVDSGATMSLTGTVSGNGSITKVGPGTLTLTNPKSYTGATIINAGTLVASYNAPSYTGVFSPGSTVTVNSGGTLSLTGTPNALGYNFTAANQSGLPNLSLNGGTLSVAASTYQNIGNISLTGATITGGGSNQVNLDQTLHTLASSITSTITTGVNLAIRNDGGIYGTGGTFDVAKGTTPNTVDLDVYAPISSFNNSSLEKLTKSGPGYMRLFAANTYTGGTTFSAGTLEIDTNGAIPSTGPITITGGTIRAGGAARTMTNPLTLSGSITLGRVTFFTGNTTVAANTTLYLDNPDAPANNDSTITNVTGIYPLTVANGPLYGAGTGYLNLNGNNSLPLLTVNTNVRIGTSASPDSAIIGNVVINSPGLLLYTANNLVGNFTPVAVNAGATLNFNTFGDTIATLTGAGSVTNLGNTGLKLVSPTGSFTGSIAGSGSFIIDGTANLGGPYTLGGNNSYTGGTGIYAANVYLASSTAIPTAAQVEIKSPGILNLNGFNTTLTSLTGNGTLNPGNAVATVNISTNTTFGQIIGTGGISKTGAGAWTVAGGSLNGPLTVNQGSLILNGDIGNPASPAATLFANSGNITLNSSQHLASLLINFNAKTSLTPGSSKLLYTKSLTLFGNASLDLADNDLALDYDGPSPLTSIASSLQSAYANGAWTGPGITSSSAASDPKHITALAYAEASQLSPAIAAQIAQTTPDSTTLLLKYTYFGDANLDGSINADDYALLDRSFAKSTPNAHWTNGDFNYDDIIDSQDYLLIDKSYALQSGALDPSLLSERQSQFGDAYVQSLIASVPEPTSLLAACGFALPLLNRRRRFPLVFSARRDTVTPDRLRI